MGTRFSNDHGMWSERPSVFTCLFLLSTNLLDSGVRFMLLQLAAYNSRLLDHVKVSILYSSVTELTGELQGIVYW